MVDIQYPIANISNENWSPAEDYLLYILEDPFIYKADKGFYLKYFRINLYVDSKGDVYILYDRRLPNRINQFFSFIPNLCKVELMFKKTENKMTLELVRQHIINQVERLGNDSNKIEWIESVKKAKTFDEVIFS